MFAAQAACFQLLSWTSSIGAMASSSSMSAGAAVLSTAGLAAIINAAMSDPVAAMDIMAALPMLTRERIVAAHAAVLVHRCNISPGAPPTTPLAGGLGEVLLQTSGAAVAAAAALGDLATHTDPVVQDTIVDAAQTRSSDVEITGAASPLTTSTSDQDPANPGSASGGQGDGVDRVDDVDVRRGRSVIVDTDEETEPGLEPTPSLVDQPTRLRFLEKRRVLRSAQP